MTQYRAHYALLDGKVICDLFAINETLGKLYLGELTFADSSDFEKFRNIVMHGYEPWDEEFVFEMVKGSSA